ncbi:Uncharacterised protein [Mycobacteroides abscessus subsp. abscessus]|nr:Uncharacterised protein [Mycobacteroides abscessus subsp. abscessus]
MSFGGLIGLMNASTAAFELICSRRMTGPAWIVRSRLSTSSRKGLESLMTPSSTSWLATDRAEAPGGISSVTSVVPLPS